MHFFIFLLLFAAFDFTAAYCFNNDVPGINIANDYKSSYFWKYHIVRFIVVTIVRMLIFSVYNI